MSGLLASLSALAAAIGLASMAASSSDDENGSGQGNSDVDQSSRQSGSDNSDETSTASVTLDDPTADPTPPSSGGTVSSSAFYGQNGQLILEAESGDAEGNWQEIRLDGETTMLWDADSSSYRSPPANQSIDFDFVVEDSGTYTIALRGARVRDVMNDSDRLEANGSLRTDTGNDAYIKVTNLDTDQVVVEPTKLFVGLGDRDEELRWGSTFDEHGSGFRTATVNVEAGTNYGLEIIGRSDAFAIDRITLSLTGRLYDENTEESPLLSDVIATVSEVETPDDEDDPDDMIDTV
ncbi:MAG: hypothetical protein AAGF27_07020 [Pseudomonadota bacterium]